MAKRRDIAVILIHGYNVSDPRQTVGKFRQHFEALGCQVEMYSYGYWPLPIQVSRRNPKFASEVAKRVFFHHTNGREVYLVAHSNGCVITHLMANKYSWPVEKMLAIHPALRETLHPCRVAKKTLVVHNDGDKAVTAGKLLGWLGKIFIPKTWKFRPWGEMGRIGYMGFNNDITNIDTNSKKDFNPTAWGHSDEFSKGKSDYFMSRLAQMLIEA